MAEPDPTEPPIAHLRAELDSLWAVVNLRLRQLQRRGILPPPDAQAAGSAISALEVEARLAPPPADELDRLDPFVEQGRAALGAARQRVAELEGAHGRALPLVAIRETFGLDPRAYSAFIATLAPELDGKFGRLFAYLQNHFERQYATVAMVAELFGEGDAVEASSLLDPTGPLMRFELVAIDPAPGPPASIQRALRPDARLLPWVRGERALDPALARCVEVMPPASRRAAPVLPERDRATWQRLEQVTDVPAELRSGLPVLVFAGPEGSGRRQWAAHAAHRLGARLLVVDVPALAVAFPGGLGRALRRVLREARLQGAVVALDGWDELPEEARRRAPHELGEALQRYNDPLALLVGDGGAEVPELGRPVERFDLSMPDHAAAVAIWSRHLPEAQRGEGADPEHLARAIRATPGRIERAVGRAFEVAAESDGRVSFAQLADALREQMDVRLGTRAQRVVSRHGWDDLIVPGDVQVQLRELCHRHRYRDRVLGEWGLGRRFGDSLGLSALFDGPPGTGKTMAAGIIAADLGLDLYQIDLSQVVSKYIGETEKNLSVVFDEAERSGAMLLFDEADSLFSKRTTVSSANDRYANLEVNYLLQRIERFSGVAILTTNFSDSIDAAFARRLSMRVKFPSPTAADRERLWRSMLSAPALPKDAIDHAKLAADYELSGGLIRNAVLRAAFLAASRDVAVDQELLSLAARIELKAQGMLVRGNPYDELA